MNKLTNKGETIVEVLISIVVIAATLSSAYYVVNNSYRQNQASLERVEGIKAAESKLELLRTLHRSVIESEANRIGGPFCINGSNFVAYNAATPDASCKIGNRYTVFITKTAQSYTIKAEWVGLATDKESAIIYFKP